ncbi:protein of unknown function [Luteibacter sp. UNC138MFCol5.1]|uniref:DUF4124 domain-containing protein n=1 Tax=Luteibacter sp. UNC138MFCol5.1 TaxID=1502774 RepID=UPI0008D20301|nr:DUF4124 domain-containing protein [Luteibacter sp. UNC138MFCol5.1]SEO46801.1 protein of unknown function [Luteibacter sp. UNC138MFCol5.1]
MIRAIALLLLLCLALPAAAQTAIHRCVGQDGRPVFSDQPCSAVGAASLLPTPSSAASTPGVPTAGLLCAKDIGELREGMAQAFAARSANRIGGLVLWDGYGSAGTVENLRAMESLVRQSLVALEGGEDSGIDAVTAPPGAQGPTRRAHFAVVRDAGCLWLRPPG